MAIYYRLNKRANSGYHYTNILRYLINENTLLFCLALFACQIICHAQTTTKNRVIIFSDIEVDPDDTQSFVRLFL